MTTTVGNVLGTVIKSDPGSFTSDGSSTPQKSKQHSSDSEILRASSHESTEDDSTHQITLVNKFVRFSSSFWKKITKYSIFDFFVAGSTTARDQHYTQCRIDIDGHAKCF